MYAFWRWLQRATWTNAVCAGAALGVVELAKSTWIVLFGLFPLLWFVHRFSTRGSVDQDRASAQRAPARQLAVIVLLAVYLLNLGYAFEGSFKRLGDHVFVSRALAGEDLPPNGGNRFSGSMWSSLPVPFPANYIRGIDVQRHDFEQKKWSYLHGEQRLGGWWYYYLYALVIKTPISILALLALAVILSPFSRRRGGAWTDELVLLAPAVVLFALVSSQTGFSRYFRYVLPALPFFYIAASRLTLLFPASEPALQDEKADSARNSGKMAPRIRLIGWYFVSALVLTSIAESASVFPHSHSFFNLLAGGPYNGHAYLVDANIDWGEDVPFLKTWYDRRPQARPLYWAYFGGYVPTEDVTGIKWEPIPQAAQVNATGPPPDLSPGWYVVSVNHLRGYRHFERDQPVHTHFLDREPCARIGYSMYVYEVPAAADPKAQ